MNRLQQLLNLRPGEWSLALAMLLLLAINTMVVELVQVVATAGFVSNVGAAQLPWVWIIDMVVLLLFAGVYAQIVDRVKRVQLVGWMLGGFAFIYLIIQLMFGYGSPDWLNYFLLFILADQQFFVFPLAFWALATDVYRIAEAKRLFPVIGAGFAFGSIIGNSLAGSSAAIFARYGGNAYQLLTLAAVGLMIGFVILQFSFRNQTLRGRQTKDTEINIRESLEMGLDFVKNVPLFRYLSLVILLAYLAYTVIQYHFLYTLDQSFATDLEFQSFYGYYKVALIVATLVFQWLVTGRLLERVQLKSSFIFFPIVILVAAGSGLAVAGLVGAAIGVFVMEVIERAWDQPARKSLQGLIPDERRGRISTFVDTYVLVAATIIASIFLLLLFSIGSWLQFSDQLRVVIYLSVAAVAAAGGIWAAVRAKNEYDQSMLNWRLSRRQRRGLTGVMKKLDL